MYIYKIIWDLFICFCRCFLFFYFFSIPKTFPRPLRKHVKWLFGEHFFPVHTHWPTRAFRNHIVKTRKNPIYIFFPKKPFCLLSRLSPIFYDQCFISFFFFFYKTQTESCSWLNSVMKYWVKFTRRWWVQRLLENNNISHIWRGHHSRTSL